MGSFSSKRIHSVGPAIDKQIILTVWAFLSTLRSHSEAFLQGNWFILKQTNTISLFKIVETHLAPTMYYLALYF